jgi:hypothetical protein
VEHGIGVRADRRDAPAVDLDARVVVDARAELPHDATADAHPPGDDQLLRAAARRDAGCRQKFLEPLRRQCPLPRRGTPYTFFKSNDVTNASFESVRASAA